MSGLIISDLGDGLCVAIVDDIRWAQIHGLDDDEAMSFLALSDKLAAETHRPSGCPDPVGQVLKTYYVQTRVFEATDFTEHVTGILFL